MLVKLLLILGSGLLCLIASRLIDRTILVPACSHKTYKQSPPIGIESIIAVSRKTSWPHTPVKSIFLISKTIWNELSMQIYMRAMLKVETFGPKIVGTSVQSYSSCRYTYYPTSAYVVHELKAQSRLWLSHSGLRKISTNEFFRHASVSSTYPCK